MNITFLKRGTHGRGFKVVSRVTVLRIRVLLTNSVIRGGGVPQFLIEPNLLLVENRGGGGGSFQLF